jgi:hypothetical protein
MVDDSTSISWESAYKISRSSVDVLIFTSVYLEPCIWPDVISRWIQQRNSECASSFVQISEKVQWRPWQSLSKCSRKSAWAVHGCLNGISKLTKTEKGQTSEVQSHEHAHHFLWHQEDCSQTIHPGRPKSQFHILLWRFTVTAWKCANTLPWTLATRELAVASSQHTISGRITGSTEHSHRTRLPGCI